MTEILFQWDQDLLLWINGSHSPAADVFFKFITGKFTWVPLYLWMLILLIRKEGKNIWIPVLSIVLMITLSDQMASGIFKPWIGRLRPCHTPELKSLLHLVDNYCGGEFGFYSSHAANTCALAFFWSQRTGKLLAWLLGIYAVLNCVSRIYLGVHYPTDILAGIGGGVFAAWVALKFEQYLQARVNK